jgi:hypothetical protein
VPERLWVSNEYTGCQPESKTRTLRGRGVRICAGRLNEEALQANSVGALEIACDDACHDDLHKDADTRCQDKHTIATWVHLHLECH